MSHTKSCCSNHQVFRCNLCDTLYESGVADNDRCPQCGFTDAKPVDDPGDVELVIRRTTKFR